MLKFSDLEWRKVILNPHDRPTIPESLSFSGVYIWIHPDSAQFLYVGESKCISKRLRDHFKLSLDVPGNAFEWKREFVIDRNPLLWVLPLPSIEERLFYERKAIAFGRPIFNTAEAGIWRKE